MVDFHSRVIFTCVRLQILRALELKIEAVYRRLRVDVEVKPRLI